MSRRPHNFIALTTVCAMPIAAAFADGDGVTAARDATGRLVGHIGPAQPLALDLNPFPDIPGYAAAIYGFESATFDEPDEGLYVLDPLADISVTLLASDPGIHILVGLAPVPVGDSIHFGHPFFDFHPVFNMPSAQPGDRAVMTFQFHDLAGRHADSEPFTLEFIAACASPCVADYDNSGGTPDTSDIDAYFADWLLGLPCADGDLSGGTPDAGDIDTFFTLWLAGGC